MNKLITFLTLLNIIGSTITGQEIVNGVVVDENNNTPVKNAKVILLGISGSEYVFLSDSMGLFKFEIDSQDRSTEFILTIIKKGYLKGKGSISYPFSSTPITIRMRSIRTFDYFPLINFDHNSYSISEKDSVDIINLASVLKMNPNATIEIGGHRELSENNSISYLRAEKIRDFLIRKGIDSNKLVTKDYEGFYPFVLRKKEALSLGLKAGTKLSQKVIDSIETKKKRLEAVGLNRRINFKVIKTE